MYVSIAPTVFKGLLFFHAHSISELQWNSHCIAPVFLPMVLQSLS